MFCFERVCPDYLPSASFLLLAALLHAMHHVYAWLWAHFLDFSLSFFCFKVFFELLCGSTTLKHLVQGGGNAVSVLKNILIKEALAFEIACFFLSFNKKLLPFDFS